MSQLSTQAIARTETSPAMLIFVLSSLSIFAPLSTDMYLSAFSDIQSYLNAPDGVLELSLSVFFLGLCLGQLLFGPLGDRYGRKTPLLVGAGLYSLTTFLLLLVMSPAAFIGLRFVQALGACGGMVIGRAVVTDLYRGNEAARTMTLLMMLVTLGPVVSPLVGGFLVSAFGWKSVFILMLLIGLLAMVLTWLFLPETLEKDQRLSAPLAQVFAEYGKLLLVRSFIVPALSSALVLGVLFSFITASSSVFQGVMGMGKVEYGLAFGFVALGLVVASLVNNRLLGRIAAADLVKYGLPFFVLSNIILVLIAGTGMVWQLLIVLWFCVALAGFLTANATAVAMSATRGKSGGGSALLGALQFAIASGCSSLVALFISDSVLPLALGMLIPAVLGALLWWLGHVKPVENA